MQFSSYLNEHLFMVFRVWLVFAMQISSVVIMGIWSIHLRESNLADQYSKKCMKPYATKLTVDDPNLKILSIARKPFRAGCDQENQRERDGELFIFIRSLTLKGRSPAFVVTFYTIPTSWASCFGLMNRLCSHQLIYKELCASLKGIMTFHSSSAPSPKSLVSIFC